jgi:EAL domain-containing protein (putative c-di-GMP-specific phosphodiesterase class I)
VSEVLQKLSALGIELVLNDFGTGYSGINNILDLPVQALKLERMFVWQLETNPRSGALIEGLIQIAQNLGLNLIAEGVETENQVTLLKKYGCKLEQGFYYSATVASERLCEVLGRGREAGDHQQV